jgi:hypothetical protein
LATIILRTGAKTLSENIIQGISQNKSTDYSLSTENVNYKCNVNTEQYTAVESTDYFDLYVTVPTNHLVERILMYQ